MCNPKLLDCRQSGNPTIQQSNNMPILQLTTFYVGDDLFGVNTKQVQEILHYQTITPVSLVSKSVRGLLNLRGQIVTVIDLRTLFDLPAVDDETFRMFLVVHVDDEPICLLVDRMHTIVGIQPDLLLPPPGSIENVTARYVQKVCQVDDEVLLIVNLERVLELEG